MPLLDRNYRIMYLIAW